MSPALCPVTLLAGVSHSVLHYGPKGQPHLLGCGDDLGGWQQEAIAPGVPEFEGEDVLDATLTGPVHRDPTGHIWIQKDKEMPQKEEGVATGMQKHPEWEADHGGQIPTTTDHTKLPGPGLSLDHTLPT